MFKQLAFIAFFLSLASVTQSQRTCEIDFYGPKPPPECETTIENGEEVETCSEIGAPVSSLLLDGGEFTYSENSTSLAEIYFSGLCKCSIKFWTRPNFEGYSITYPFCKSPTGEIFTDQIWERPNNSFNITCVF